MKHFFVLTYLLVIAVAVLGILAESEEFSPDVMDCLEELHPLYQQAMANAAKCKQDFPIPQTADAMDANHVERLECVQNFYSPEIVSKLEDFGERSDEILLPVSETHMEKVKKYLEREEWSRVL